MTMIFFQNFYNDINLVENRKHHGVGKLLTNLHLGKITNEHLNDTDQY